MREREGRGGRGEQLENMDYKLRRTDEKKGVMGTHERSVIKNEKRVDSGSLRCLFNSGFWLPWIRF